MRTRLDDSIDIASHPALFGSLRHPGLVNVSADREGVLTLFRRSGNDLIEERIDSFRPFLWLTTLELLRDFKEEYQAGKLDGTNAYQFLVTTPDWPALKTLSKYISDVAGVYPNHPDSPQLLLNDLPTQYLLATGQTYYNRMAIEDVKSLSLRVYTTGDLSDEPDGDPDRIVAVALKEGLDGPCHLLNDPEEDKLLWHVRGKLKKLDPDLIQGHNLFNRDLERLKDRTKKHRVKLDWGRSGLKFTGRRTKMIVAEKQLDYRRHAIGGRELADSWILSILHDVSGRELTGYELADVAAHFSLPVGKKGDTLEERARKDTSTIAKLHRNLIYPYFLQSQIFPLSFENVILRGNATRINHLFLREYYRLGHSIPHKPEVVSFAGGLTAQEHEGCAYGVYHCDVASLYPSLIIAYNLGPSGDALKIFVGLLEALKDFRFLAKSQQKEAGNETEEAFFGNLQTTFKILINSFYGYLGFGQGHFADFERAAEVTRLGRELLKKMITWLKAGGCQILEVDTDGIYFVPSERFSDSTWIDELNRELPQGVRVEFDGRYPGMYCHKMKNYALLEDNGNLILRGSGLRSRALEPFLRNFIEDLIRASLAKGTSARLEVFEDYESRLKSGQIGVDQLAKTETLINNPGTYAKKIAQGGRNRAAVYELALAGRRNYRAGDIISYYVTGEKATVTVYDHCELLENFDSERSNLNIKYYLKKLKATFQKFDPILSKTEIRSPIPYDQLPRPTD
jgi:DNA polymerase, archaea type